MRQSINQSITQTTNQPKAIAQHNQPTKGINQTNQPTRARNQPRYQQTNLPTYVLHVLESRYYAINITLRTALTKYQVPRTRGLHIGMLNIFGSFSVQPQQQHRTAERGPATQC